MSAGSRDQRIVVGFDGSDCGTRALNWALAEADLRGVGVLIVHVFNKRIGGVDQILTQLVASDAEAILDRALQRARDAGVAAEGKLEDGSPGKALVQASDGAQLLVVGSRGRGGLGGALLGSVSTTCVHHATCPIVVVPPPNRIERAKTAGDEAGDLDRRPG